jgi:hypothetical protein
VLNRTLPTSLRQPAAGKAARELVVAVDEPALIKKLSAALRVDSAELRPVLNELGERFHDIAVVASREAERRAELEAIGALTIAAPSLAHDIHDLAGLLELGQHLLDR